MLASTVTTTALVLGLYATAVSTAVALVTLYGEVFARIDVIAREAYLVREPGRPPIVVVGDDALEVMDPSPGADVRDIVTIAIRNRGRRPTQITTMSKPGEAGFHILEELLPAFPLIVEPGRTETLTIEHYRRGDLGEIKRFFVADGAGRIHPLRERWRQMPGRWWRRVRRRRD